MTEIPDDAPDSEATLGVPVGPPALSPLGLPKALEVRLHNELFHRGLLTKRDIIKRQVDIGSAIQSAMKVAVKEVQDLYD